MKMPCSNNYGVRSGPLTCAFIFSLSSFNPQLSRVRYGFGVTGNFLVFLSAFQLLSISAFAQGTLAPPGAPAPTMQTLDQLGAKADQANTKLDQVNAKTDTLDAKSEKRTPISSVPVTIAASGSYYLTGNLQFSAASGDAIAISQSNVTLDLMGFTLSSSAGVTGNAISLNGNARNITIKNGAVAGSTTVTVSGNAPNQTWTSVPAGFSNGIAGGVNDCHYTDLRISGCRNTGLSASNSAAIDHVTASSNGTFGIFAIGGSVTNSTATTNLSSGLIANIGSVSNCVGNSNGGTGIFANVGTVTNCTGSSNGANGILGSSVSNSFAGSNGANGITALGGSVTNCLANSNGTTGILVANGSVTNSVAASNGNDGISAGNGVVAFCRAGLNNTNNNGSVEIVAVGATRTGNFPTP